MSVCKGCGKEIIWGVTADGKRIPLDKTAPVYVQDHSFESADGEPVVRRPGTAWVSHFATCPKANDFSAVRKK